MNSLPETTEESISPTEAGPAPVPAGPSKPARHRLRRPELPSRLAGVLVTPVKDLLDHRFHLPLQVIWLPPKGPDRRGGAVILYPMAAGRTVPREVLSGSVAWLRHRQNTSSPVPLSGIGGADETGWHRFCIPVLADAKTRAWVLVLFQVRVSPGEPETALVGVPAPGVVVPSSSRSPMAYDLFPHLAPGEIRAVEKLLRRQARELSVDGGANAAIGRIRGKTAPELHGPSGGNAALVGVGPRRRAGLIVGEIRRFIHENYHRRLTLDDLANALQMNAAYLSSLFSRVSGETVHQHLESVRMGRAKELLSDPRARIREVAAAVGYASADAFRHAFKAFTGVAPSDWR